MRFSCIIPAKDVKDDKLADLIQSIRDQDYPQDQVDIDVVTEGDSEQAKAIGIKRAKGDICAMFCADNMIMNSDLFKWVRFWLKSKRYSAVYTDRYHYKRDDNSLNRYFALMGCNDPVPYYLGKNDRAPHVEKLRTRSNYLPSYGCNGFFYRASEIKKTDLDNYYPMDNAMEVEGEFVRLNSDAIWHRTNDNLWTTLVKRYKYAKDLYCDRTNRRWKMFHTREDYIRGAIFVIRSFTFIDPLYTSIKGFKRIRDMAWFWHPIVCFTFTIMYGLLTLRTACKRLLSYRPWAVKTA